jgi:hypothetical protein
MWGRAMAESDIPDKNDFTEHYNTELSAPEQDSFNGWVKDQSDKTGRDVGKDVYDYDLQGYWQKNAGDSEDGPQLTGGHLTDEFKKPNHPTFSDQSKYHGVAGNEGGTWEQLPGGESGVQAWSFKPGATNLEHHEPAELKSYFDKVEPGNALEVPDHGAPGQIDRSRIRSELEQNPALADRLNQMVRGEVGSRATPEVRRIQMETAMNRALARGHSLDQALWDTSMAGSRGYYPRASFTRGGFDKDTFGGDLEAVLSGSNYAGKYGKGLITGNASADVARHQFARGTPGFTVDTGSGPESYFSEGPFRTDVATGKLGTTQVAEYKGKASAEEAGGWGTIGGSGTTKGQIEKNLQRGPMLVPKTAPGAKEFLKDNPDVEYKDYEDHWLIQPFTPPETAPLVGQAKGDTRVAGRTARVRSSV